MRTITVKVTQEHIDRARRLVSIPGAFVGNCCAMALALRESGFPAAIITCNSWRTPFSKMLFPLDDDARKFVSDFDVGNAVRPATFEVLAPEAGGAGEGGG